MTTFSGTDANQAIADFMAEHSADLPEQTRDVIAEVLTDGQVSVVEILTTMDALYQAREEIPVEALRLCHGLAEFIAVVKFHGRGDDAASMRDVLSDMLPEPEPEEPAEPPMPVTPEPENG